ncbi:MAG: type II toxin-antitoxin system VapC family toxin [Pseudomonadota bacterium]
MIADTSAWIEYLRATGSRAHRHLSAVLHEREPVHVLPAIVQELLQGARSPAHFMQLQRLMAQFRDPPALPPARELARDAAALYARCRWQGLTIRSPNDCLIAATAAATGQPLLAQDRDFAALAQVEPGLTLV